MNSVLNFALEKYSSAFCFIPIALKCLIKQLFKQLSLITNL